MQYVGLKTREGTYLEAQEDGRLAASRTAPTPTAVFEWLGLDSGRINLRAIATGQRITVEPNGDGGRVTTSAPNPWDALDLIDLDALMAEAMTQRSCCGHAHVAPGPAPEFRRKTLAPQWREETHAQVVETAFFMISLHAAIPGAETLIALWDNPTFKAALHRGLIDADAFGNLTYTGVLYEKHFYDPDTGTNYFGFTSGTALTEGLRYFRAAASHLAALKPNLSQKRPLPPAETDCMGYKLGLSLHYFTDLTQPMHAANFANVFASGQLHDWRHSGFETYAEANRGRFVGDPQHVRREQIDPALLGFTSPADILHTVAVNAKRIFVEQVAPLAAQKLHEHPLLPPSLNSTWGAEADPALQQALPYGQNMTAAFLLYWATF